jgi:hypothetical protein
VGRSGFAIQIGARTDLRWALPQIEEAFGWEPYAAVFGAYLQQTSAQRPANDAARAQEWVIQISRATGRDLSDSHAAWGFDIAPTTRAQLADLPAWDEHPMR